MLIIMAGLPGTGKTTLSHRLARELGATHVRVDTIEAALAGLDMEVGAAGYHVAFLVARDNLLLGGTVVADSVNPVTETREGWRDVAHDAGAAYREVEVVCSDVEEHRRRVEARRAAWAAVPARPSSAGMPPTWAQVLARSRAPWTTERLVVDTAGRTVEESAAWLLHALAP